MDRSKCVCAWRAGAKAKCLVISDKQQEQIYTSSYYRFLILYSPQTNIFLSTQIEDERFVQIADNHHGAHTSLIPIKIIQRPVTLPSYHSTLYDLSNPKLSTSQKRLAILFLL